MSECQANIKKEGLVMIGMSLNIVALLPPIRWWVVGKEKWFFDTLHTDI